MLAILSPAKTLDYKSPCPAHRPSQPRYLEEAAELMGVLKKKSRPQLRELMKISEKLADENFERFKAWAPPFDEDNARAALLAFKGDVYTGFELENYGQDDFRYAQKHLLILSGLYGLLRPLDLMQPYRLEMGTQLKTPHGKSLYEFWGDKLTRGVRAACRKSGTPTLVNLASNEYFSALQPDDLQVDIITPQFKDLKNGAYKFLSYYGKQARGMMADYMIRERIDEPEGLKDFSRAGYRFNSKLSADGSWVFTRDKVPSAA